MENINKCKELTGKIYVLYIKSKVALAEAHITRSPKLYFEKFNIRNDPEINIEIIDYLVTRESPVYAELSRKSWVLFVLEITKILSRSKGEKFSIGKLYNKLLNKEFKENISLDCFNEVLKVIDDNDQDSTLNKLKLLRDKFYAHTDDQINILTQDLFPTYNEVWDLMNVIERFLVAIYSEYDAGIDLRIDRFLNKYAREFEKTYKYFQNTMDTADTYRLERHFSKLEIEGFRKKTQHT
ncbi:AbiU2 domain-containing protein [Sphingobacterium suaedae]|uniref:HEPN AbiU2-like domain-containing protein n=1 Tax=Sphingobacterium suaedae TaxID=1686402 RepID=A0ABW5KK96_9SPHI